MKIVGYIRVSTEDQAERGVSLDAQAERIRAYAEFMRHELVEIVADRGVSAKTTNRPGLIRALSMVLENGQADGLVVYSVDRFVRSTVDLLGLVDRFAKAGKEFVSLREQIESTTPHGRFVMTLFGALAQMERELTSSRTKEALQQRKAEGKPLGTVPYGYRKVMGRLAKNPHEQDVLDIIMGLHADERSPAKIAGVLSRMGIKTRSGSEWMPASIYRIIARHEGRGE